MSDTHTHTAPDVPMFEVATVDNRRRRREDACGARRAGYPPGWKIDRPPRCNRPAGHDGDHVEYDPGTFAERCRFGADEVKVS